MVKDDLAEWDYGAYEGLTTREILAQRRGWQLFRDGCPDGESVADAGARADRIVAGLRDAGGNVLVFSSAHFLRVLAARWLGSPPQDGAHFVLDTASISVLGYERDHHRRLSSGRGIKGRNLPSRQRPNSSAIIDGRNIAESRHCSRNRSIRQQDRNSTMQIGMMGLGRMGGEHGSPPHARRSRMRGLRRQPRQRRGTRRGGGIGGASMEEFIRGLAKPRSVWLMLPGGNHRRDRRPGGRTDGARRHHDRRRKFAYDAVDFAARLQPKGISFVDVGTSGGVWASSAAIA